MNLMEKIKTLYPDMTDKDFCYPVNKILLQNDLDGRGDYIKEWGHPIHPKPTDEQLAAIN